MSSVEPQETYNSRKRGEYARRVAAMTVEEREAHLSGLRAKTDRWYKTMTPAEREDYLRQERLRHRERSRDPAYKPRAQVRSRRHISRRYGLTLEDYEALVSQPCFVCGEAEQRRGVDHCHETGRVRGALCHACNMALGLLKDDLERIHALADYLEGSRDE